MSHEIYEHDTQVFGRGKAAWHGLGKVVDGLIGPDEILTESGLNWTVDKQPLYVAQPDGSGVLMPDKFVTIRTDLPADEPARFLGVVGNKYTPIQNAEARDLMVRLCAQDGVQFETAGSLMNGRRVWFLAVMPEKMGVMDDELQNYILLRNSHDASCSLEAMFTSIRVVCQNTLSAAVRGSRHRVAVRHTANATSEDTGKAVRALLQQGTKYFGTVTDVFREMSMQKVNSRFVSAYLKALIPDPKGKSNTRAENNRTAIAELFNGGQMGGDLEAVRGTRWGLYNAVTEFIDHDKTVAVHRKGGDEATGAEQKEARFNSVLLGAGANMRQKAFDLMQDSDKLMAEALVTN